MWSFCAKIATYRKAVSKIAWSKFTSILRADDLQNTQNNVPFYWVEPCWDGFWPAGLCFAIGFSEENTSFPIGQEKNLLKNSVKG